MNVLLSYLLCSSSNSGSAGQVATKWSSYLSDGRWKIYNNKFWTTGYDFHEMSKIDPDLYSQLSKASLIIFKVSNLNKDKNIHSSSYLMLVS